MLEGQNDATSKRWDRRPIHMDSIESITKLESAYARVERSRQILESLSCVGNYTISTKSIPNGDRAVPQPPQLVLGIEGKPMAQRSDVEDKLHYYFTRQEQHQCQKQSLWGEDIRDKQKCSFLSIGKMFDFQPGDLVLDWGSGCGHELALLRSLFGISGFGIDMVTDAVSFAKRTYENAGPEAAALATKEGQLPNRSFMNADTGFLRFCQQNGANLRNIPSATFDYVISYAAVYHMPNILQCHVLRQLLRVTKPGGKVWIGFIQEFPTMWMPVTCARWARCIDERENPWKKRKRARKPDSADQQNDQNQKRNRQESEGTEAEGGAAEEQASLTSQQKAQLKKAKMGTALEAIGLGGGDEDGQESIEEYEESKYQQEGESSFFDIDGERVRARIDICAAEAKLFGIAPYGYPHQSLVVARVA